MLHARPVVVLDVLLDLALLAALGRLVDRHHDLAAVPHDGRHQRRVLGADLLVVEVHELGEAHHVGVEVDPRVELATGDVADDVVDGDEANVGANVGVGEFVVGVPGLEGGAAVTQAVDERVHRLAIGGDLGELEVAVLVVLDPRLAHAAGATSEGGRVGGSGVVDEPGEVVDPVSVAAHVIGDRRVGLQRPRHDPADVALFEDVAGLVAPSSLRAGIAGAAEPEVRHQEAGGGASVADPELDAVPTEEMAGRCVPAGRRDGGVGGAHPRSKPDDDRCGQHRSRLLSTLSMQ